MAHFTSPALANISSPVRWSIWILHPGGYSRQDGELDTEQSQPVTSQGACMSPDYRA
jgi:hypothetical protein